MKDRIFNILNKFRQEKFMTKSKVMIDISEFDNLMDSVLKEVEPEEE